MARNPIQTILENDYSIGIAAAPYVAVCWAAGQVMREKGEAIAQRALRAINRLN